VGRIRAAFCPAADYRRGLQTFQGLLHLRLRLNAFRTDVQVRDCKLLLRLHTVLTLALSPTPNLVIPAITDCITLHDASNDVRLFSYEARRPYSRSGERKKQRASKLSPRINAY
jgi:hypothetical protein